MSIKTDRQRDDGRNRGGGLKRRDLLLSGSSLARRIALSAVG